MQKTVCAIFCLNLQFNLLKHNRLSYKPMTDLIVHNKINTYIINTCVLTDFQCYIICILKLKLKQYICITKIEHLASMALVDNLKQLWVFCNNYEFNCSISVIFKTNFICFKVCLHTSCIKEIITHHLSVLIDNLQQFNFAKLCLLQNLQNEIAHEITLSYIILIQLATCSNS